ncbi:MAG TPA: N-acetyltransferase [Ignavibacteria bacterium]|nr:N-acetyltransferase [Ignavibacteria bacterium]
MNNDVNIEIRSFHFSDITALYKICLLTGDSGKDATKLYNEPDLLGHYYAAPYAIFEPELAYVLTINYIPCGYILGTKNTKNFAAKCEKDWFPVLRKKYPTPNKNDSSLDANIIKLIHKGYILKEELLNYPAHLHIDLLPVTQGKGLGRKMIDTFVDKLKSENITGLHLEVGKKNTNAIGFYKRVGFEIIKEYEHSIAFGMNI